MSCPNKKIQSLILRYPVDAQVFVDYIPKGNKSACEDIQENRERKENRRIIKPNKPLSSWLKEVHKVFCGLFNDWPHFIHGGLKGHSYVMHAACHVRQQCVITIDIRKCFDSIKQSFIAPVLHDYLNLDIKLCNALASKLCYKGSLAQGFATSSFICNLYLVKPLNDLYSIFSKDNLCISSYVDDIAISGRMSSIEQKHQAVNNVAKALSRYQLKINKKKTRVMTAPKPQIICGLRVNHVVNITKERRNEVFRCLSLGKIEQDYLIGLIASLKNVNLKSAQKLRQYAISKGFDV